MVEMSEGPGPNSRRYIAEVALEEELNANRGNTAETSGRVTQNTQYDSTYSHDSFKHTTTRAPSLFSGKGTFYASPGNLGAVGRSKSPHLLHEKDDSPEQNPSIWSRFKNTMVVTWQLICRYPSVAIVPFCIFALLVGLGTFGALAGAQSVVDSDKDLAISTATVVGAGFVEQVQKSFAPLSSMRAYLLQHPEFYEFKYHWPSFSQSLLYDLPPGTIDELQCSPMGVVSAVYPDIPDLGHIDIFSAARLRPGALTTMRLNALVLSGPLVLVAQNPGERRYAGIARLPIFIENQKRDEDWGYEQAWPTDCAPGNSTDGCYELAWQPQKNNTKFWGFVTALIAFDALTKGEDSRLADLTKNGYRFLLVRPATSGDGDLPEGATEYTIATNSEVLDDPVSVTLNVSNNVWTLYVSAEDGWRPRWEIPVIISVIIISFIIGLLVMFTMLAKKQQECLLEEVLVANTNLAETTRKLADEKVRTDALLVRQFNLIECFGKAKDSLNDSTDGTAMDRIEAVRRQLNKDNIKSLAESENIETLELLGQGMFGKVYKGLWRGTEVAVKTLVLPANMSGAERREKMAVMEAAISSSLAHPNIVQTYTYNIKPVVEAKDSALSMNEVVVGESQASPGANSTIKKGEVKGTVNTFTRDTPGSNVHSYEVKMVLEYCDKGALRDALDCGAFFGDEGLNYKGILDILADIAKAMLHLHSSSVLHADLKASNVMLKSSGEPRSVMAKVADFGLSVRMDHMETHLSNVYQGTLTHMAPEIMLDGRISKAADVYAFGVTMWEIFTGCYAYKGTPRALLGHQVTRESMRPKFPLACPFSYRHLAERCWAPKAEDRPPFEEVLTELIKMRAELEGPTPKIMVDMEKQKERQGEEAANKAKADTAAKRAAALISIQSTDAMTAGVVVGGGSTIGQSGLEAAGIVVSPSSMAGSYIGRIPMNPDLPTVVEDNLGEDEVENGATKV